MSGRIKNLLNHNWKFMHGDFPEGKDRSFDDGEWYDTGLPHSFGIPYFMENEFYVGYGCYRKTLRIDELWIGKRVSLEFQGVFQEAEIYVNGCLAGTHSGGYTAFEINISPFIVAGENQLFVRVNNLWNPQLAPRAGEHVFNGGIYRDVSLLVTEQVYITWYGTSVTTPQVSYEKAGLVIQTEVKAEKEVPVTMAYHSADTDIGQSNDLGEEKECELVSSVRFSGTEVARISTFLKIRTGEMTVAVQECNVVKPQLWHPDTPHLYQLESTVYVENEPVDHYETEFGIRWFSFTSDKGFFLNGEHYPIYGANVHQDHAGWADAVTHSGIRRDIRLIKECGMNLIRGSHYPHHTYFAEECDRQGILFWSENCFWGTGGPQQEGYWTASAYPVNPDDEAGFEKSCEQSLAEMIRTNRNHPSIIAWSMCNEPFFSGAQVMDKARDLIGRLVAVTHELDPSRPAAVGGVQRGGFDSLGDLAGYNGDGATLFRNPGFPNLVCEYGSKIADRPGEYESRYMDGVEMDYPWRSGKVLWCGFHHGSILDDMGHMGMIDYYRLPLLTWYWYRERLMGIRRPETVTDGVPHAIRLTADTAVISDDGTEDAHVMVMVVDQEGKRLANSPEVILKVVSGGAIFPTGRTFVFSPKGNNFAEGIGAIEVRSCYAGETVIRAESKGLICAELRLHVTGRNTQGSGSKELQPPPELTGMPEREELLDIALGRPVFCSSARAKHEGRYVTDGDDTTDWYPAVEGDGEWILVDLEGKKSVKRVGIVFAEVTNVVYEISLSEDREQFEVIYTSKENDPDSSVFLNLHSVKTRYVRVRFPGRSAAIRRIELYA